MAPGKRNCCASAVEQGREAREAQPIAEKLRQASGRVNLLQPRSRGDHFSAFIRAPYAALSVDFDSGVSVSVLKCPFFSIISSLSAGRFFRQASQYRCDARRRTQCDQQYVTVATIAPMARAIRSDLDMAYPPGRRTENIMPLKLGKTPAERSTEVENLRPGICRYCGSMRMT